MFDPSKIIGDFDWNWTDPPATVGVHSVVGANPNRTSIYFVNKGTVNLFFGPFADVSTNNFLFEIAPNGTTALYWAYDGILTMLPWWVYVSGLGGNYGCGEVIYTPQRI